MNEVTFRRAMCAILAGTTLLIAACSAPASPPPLQGAKIGGPFALTDQDGRTVRDSDFAGRYRLVYFGYTFCPDVCPADLQSIGQAMRQFERSDPQRAARLQLIFITIDPERDTSAVLKPYVAAFHPRLIGLTGTAEQISSVGKAFGIYAAQRPAAPGQQYLVDHSRQATLFGPAGEPIALVPQDQGAKAIVDELEKWVK